MSNFTKRGRTKVKLLLMCDLWLIRFVALDRLTFQSPVLGSSAYLFPFLPKSAVSDW